MSVGRTDLTDTEDPEGLSSHSEGYGVCRPRFDLTRSECCWDAPPVLFGTRHKMILGGTRLPTFLRCGDGDVFGVGDL